MPEIDTYYKITSPVRIWFQAKETNQAGAPVTAEIGPSLDFYVQSPLKFENVTAFDSDDSKSRFLVISVGYRYLPTPSDPPIFEMAENQGSAVKHQRFVGTGYFDAIATTISNGQTSTRALPGSTETEQFEMDTQEYNDEETTERTPMPHLYTLLESLPLPSTAAND